MSSIYENTPLEECKDCSYRLSRLKRDLEKGSGVEISSLPKFNSYSCNWVYCGLDAKDKFYGPVYDPYIPICDRK
ncbi:hypothetical protein J4205_01890 [Candidatus Pacearchaeota archaeon]|nr:hypothetical protein [Candidatus Pacearchaeota archaeon]